jgi:hypothetical protein
MALWPHVLTNMFGKLSSGTQITNICYNLSNELQEPKQLYLLLTPILHWGNFKVNAPLLWPDAHNNSNNAYSPHKLDRLDMKLRSKRN